MRILLDECLPRKLRNYLLGHQVRTVPQQGWASIENGALLRLAEGEFDAFITVDKNLEYQQDLSTYKIAVVVLRARSNQVKGLQPLVPALLEALEHLREGEVLHVAE